ncbi:MAG: phosphonate C-P lyase system protein PhnG [Candidatus Tectomicrobia bacterium]|nr:phosphonate C-P lyase system protein PhnG [Candidatus Tectomicrobia bacterium]
MTPTDSAKPAWPPQRDRQAWLATLARASVNDLEHAWSAFAQPPACRERRGGTLTCYEKRAA